MSYRSGIITAPVAVSDISLALGIANYDVGTLCRSSKINKWAMYKPVVYESVEELTGTQRRGSNGRCGFSLTYCKGSSLASTVKSVLSNTSLLQWSYSPPSTYFRVLDFKEYNSGSLSPFVEKLYDQLQSTAGDASSIIVTGFNSDAYGQPYNFTPDEMAIDGLECGEWYPGFIIVNSSQTIAAIVTSDLSMGNFKGYIDTAYNYIYYTPSAFAKAGTYSKLFMMSSKQYYGSGGYYSGGSVSIDSSGYFALFPCLPGTIEFISPAQLYIHPKVSVSSTGISIQFYGTNKTTVDVSYPTINVYIQYWIDQDDGGSWGEVKSYMNFQCERSVLTAGSSNEYLINDYILYSKSNGWPKAQVYKVIIEGVDPSYLGDDETSFRDVDGSVWG